MHSDTGAAKYHIRSNSTKHKRLPTFSSATKARCRSLSVRSGFPLILPTPPSRNKERPADEVA
jgi:hypothetical protein